MKYSIYCDESCHLEHDHQKVLVLGGLMCPTESVREVTDRFADIRSRYYRANAFEIKWRKVSSGREDFYSELVNEFFDREELSFRAVVVPDKSVLDHERFSQTHDSWLFKMYFELLKVMVEAPNTYRVFLDIKDTRSADKLRHLRDVLCNSNLDFEGQLVERIQNVRSDEVLLTQVSDLLIGAVAYESRNLSENSAKAHLVNLIEDRANLRIRSGTTRDEKKFNVFRWSAK